MDKIEARQCLMQHGWLSMMPVDFATRLLDICVWKKYNAHQPLYAAGDGPGGIYGVACGAIGFTAALGRPDSPLGHISRAVFWTGWTPLLSGEARRVSVVAIEEAMVAYVPLPPLKAMLAERPEWWRHFAQALLIDLDVVHTIANDLMIRSTAERCAATLLRVADCRFTDSVPHPVVHATQDSLAAMTNLSRGSLSGVLNGMAENGYIEIGYRTITLHNLDALRAIAEGD